MTTVTRQMVSFSSSVGGSLCGKNETPLQFWDPDLKDVSQCFVRLCLICPAYFLLALVSIRAFHKCLHVPPDVIVTRTVVQKVALWTRLFSVVLLSVSPALCLTLMFVLDPDPSWSDCGYSIFIETSFKSLGFLCQLGYVVMLIKGREKSPRGRKSVLIFWAVCAVLSGIQARSQLKIYFPPGPMLEKDVMFASIIMFLGGLALYLMTLIPGPHQEEPTGDQERLMDASPGEGPGARRHRVRPNYLGVAKDNDNFFSRLSLYWANPLIKKGRQGKISGPADVFDLPASMNTMILSQRFQMLRSEYSRRGDIPLLRMLIRAFGRPFLGVGVLKFIADCAGFASPILLNLVITFMEDEKTEMKWGYIYAGSLALSTFVVALCNTHFNLQMSELGLRMRASIITAVYRQTLGVTSLNLSTFSTGQVINFMTTDTDRVVNFSPSLHAAWSLPFQFAVTLFLLYQQVGISCLAGVVIAVLMIPLNIVIAKAIGNMSNKMMTEKDQRVKTMSEILYGIRVIKYFSWEDYFSEKIEQVRKLELKYLKGRKYLDALCVYLWATTPVLISVCTFSMYVLLGNTLTAAKVFTSVALFAMLTGPLNAFPWVINGLIESLVSVRRLSEFLSLNQFQRDDFFTKIGTVDKTRTKDVVISNGNFGIQLNDGQPDSFMLRDINLTIKKGEVLGIIGKVGQGKTTLLKAILGELKKQSGTISVSDPHMGIGYAAQEPWLIQGSIRHNILFGKEYNHVWYEKIIDACALKQDLLEMPAGDGTEVGENGCMLSGGQKARVALARTVYQNKDIILIDDIFSSVDTPVGSHIYNKCILQLLRHKTRIIVTHHLRFLAGASTVVVMNQGKIVESGDPKNLLNKTDFEKELDWNEDEKEEEKQDKKIASPEEQELLEAESRETGVVKLDIYKKYWSSVGNVLSPVILLSLLLMQASRNFTDVWLAEWVSKDEHNASLTKGEEDIDFYLSIYGSIAGLNTIFSLIRAFLFAYGGVCAAYTVHKKLFEVVMKAKVVFFDCTPVGRILNRFSSDLYTVDDSLPFILNIFLAQLFGVIGPLVVCMYSVPWIVIILVPLAFVYHDIQKKYRPASRDLKRIGSVSLSPIYSHFSETLTGHPTIRAMKEINRFSQQNEEMVENNQKAQYAGIAAAQWLELRLQLIGCAVVTGICVISVIQHHTDSINPGYVGLAISYALGITGKLSDLVKTFTETEKELVAVERCYQYIKRTPMEQESPGITITPRNWPSGGVVGFEEVRLKYREGLPYALNCLDFKTRQQEKVGIVGRTGSGKSSIFQALFRFVDISGGNISIDGVKIHTLDLKELRRAITIIPQDPFLFSGTIRENLDPLGKYGDVNLWESLHRARLEPVIRAMGGLDALVQERGRSFSVGERQLICLARAMLSPAKIVCVDEATANVDLETDLLLQDVLRTCLSDRTVLTIAHRVETIMCCDRVIFMANGRALEIGNPRQLLQDPTSEFSKHVAKN